jgi:hypothetical protein
MDPTRWTSRLEGLAGTLTLLGVLLYVALSVPASIFYTILEASPQTAGLTYIGLLTGSIVGVAVIVILGTLILFSVAAVLAFTGFFAQMANIVNEALRYPPLKDQDDEQFEAYLITMRKFYKLLKVEDIGISFDERKARAVRRRKLERMPSRTSDESAELARLLQPLEGTPAFTSALLSGTRGLTHDWLRRHWRALTIVFVTLIVVALMPVSAMQAFAIREGYQDLGSKLGLFAYGGQPVSISPALKDHPASIDLYAQRELFLLGQNGQQVVLYSPADKRSITLPVNSVIITSR